MWDRRTVLALSATVLAFVAVGATYVTVFTFGDPFSGTWTPNPDDAHAVVIKLTRGGYLLAVATGQTSTGWFSARRSGSTLRSTVRLRENGVFATSRLAFRSLGGHLVEVDNGNLTTYLTKMSSSTSLPPEQSPVMGVSGG